MRVPIAASSGIVRTTRHFVSHASGQTNAIELLEPIAASSTFTSATPPKIVSVSEKECLW